MSLQELDHSKDYCRNLHRRSEISLEGFKISRGFNHDKRNTEHWEFYLLVILSLATTSPESLFTINTKHIEISSKAVSVFL